MKKVAIEDVQPDRLGADSSRRKLSDIVGASNMALNHYRLAPGDGFPAGLHAHMDQEEVFVVLEGAATFETLDGEVTVTRGDVIRVSPGEFQSGRNASDKELVVLALGAPRESSDIRIPADCPACGHDNLRLDTSEAELLFDCPACESTHVPQDCPNCGHADLAMTRKDGQTVAVCRDCDAVFEAPPLEE